MSDGIETIRNAEVGDVAVRKTIETGDDDTATVTLEVSVHREEPLIVQLTEPVLSDVPTDDVDLHGEYGPEHWRLDDGAVFERRFDGGESCTTVYRVRNVDEERFRQIDADPDIEVEAVAGVGGSLEDVVDREGSEAVRNLIEGRADSLSSAEIAGAGAESPPDAPPNEPGDRRSGGRSPAWDTDAGEAGAGAHRSGPSVDSPDGVQGSADGIEGAAGPGVEETAESGVGGASVGDVGGATDGGVAEALLAELRAGEVDDEVARELRDELRVGKSHDVRIRHLQRQVGDLAAYVDVLESFIDEHGTFEEAFGDLLADLEGLDQDVATLGDDLEALSGRVTDEIEDLRDAVAGLEDGQDDVLDSVEAVNDELATVEERLEEVETFADRLSGVFQHVDGDVDR